MYSSWTCARNSQNYSCWTCRKSGGQTSLNAIVKKHKLIARNCWRVGRNYLTSVRHYYWWQNDAYAKTEVCWIGGRHTNLNANQEKQKLNSCWRSERYFVLILVRNREWYQDSWKWWICNGRLFHLGQKFNACWQL